MTKDELEEEIENLNEQIDAAHDRIDFLKESNFEKDERIKRLNEKIQKLMGDRALEKK